MRVHGSGRAGKVRDAGGAVLQRAMHGSGAGMNEGKRDLRGKSNDGGNEGNERRRRGERGAAVAIDKSSPSIASSFGYTNFGALGPYLTIPAKRLGQLQGRAFRIRYSSAQGRVTRLLPINAHTIPLIRMGF